MKITENSSFINIDAYIKNIDKHNKIPDTEVNKANDSHKIDNVEISSLAKRLQTAKSIMDTIPDIREQKISQIKMQIENGTYQFNEKKIASRMIRESLNNMRF